MLRGRKYLQAMASAFALALVVFSCKSNLKEAEHLDLDNIPLQQVDGMFFVQTENGKLKMRVEAPVMQVFEKDTFSYDLFPKGLEVYAYAEDGSLETTITSNEARHDKIVKTGAEKWSAYGNVVIKNIIKNETMETDTIYWDQAHEEIYTDCYVKMYSDDGFMQGYGMRSDDHARNAILRRPFNSYGVTEKDTTKIVIDSVNFIGPFKKKR